MIRRLVLLNAFLASAAGGCDGWHKLDNPSKDCAWVSKNPASRCYDTYGGDVPARTACAGACGTVDAVKADSTTWFHTKDNGKEKGCDWVRDDKTTVEGPGLGEIPARCHEARGQEKAAACCEACAALPAPTGAPTRPGIGESEIVCVDTNGDALDRGNEGCGAYALGDDDGGCGTFWDDDDFSANEMCCVCGGGQRSDTCAAETKKRRCQREFACGWSKKTGCSSQTSDDCYSGKARKKAKHCEKIDCCEWDGGECGANGACDAGGTFHPTPRPTFPAPTPEPSPRPTRAPTASRPPTGGRLDGTAWTQLGEYVYGEGEDDIMGAVATSRDGNVIVLGATGNQGNGWQAGHARVYEWAETSGGYGSYGWAQRGPDIDAEMNNGIYGGCVDMSHDGSIITVGAQWNDGAAMLAGHVRVLRWNAATGDHDIMGQDLDGEAAVDEMGSSCALSGDGYTVAIGAPENDGGSGEDAGDDDRGHARVFQWDAGDGRWMQLGDDIEGEEAGDQAGSSIAVSADGLTVAIGAVYHDGNKGQVRVFSWDSDAGAWAPKGAELAGDAGGDHMHRVALNDAGTAVAVSMKGDDGPDGQSRENAGSVAVYDWDGTTWLPRGNALHGDAAEDYAGSLSMNAAGDVIAVGATGDDSANGDRTGSVKVFQWHRDDAAWAQVGAELLGHEAMDFFGAFLALNGAGDRLAVTSYYGDGPDSHDSARGEARVYQLS